MDYLYEEYCDEGRRRKLFAVGVSLGAGILGNYLTKEKANTPLTAACCLACHFDTFKAMDFLATNLYGFFDYGIGFFTKMSCSIFLKQYDDLIAKMSPDRVVCPDGESLLRLSEYSRVIAKAAGYRSVKEYFLDSSFSHRLKDIKVPTFFMNALDDPLYGPYVIPID